MTTSNFTNQYYCVNYANGKATITPIHCQLDENTILKRKKYDIEYDVAFVVNDSILFMRGNKGTACVSNVVVNFTSKSKIVKYFSGNPKNAPLNQVNLSASPNLLISPYALDVEGNCYILLENVIVRKEVYGNNDPADYFYDNRQIGKDLYAKLPNVIYPNASVACNRLNKKGQLSDKSMQPMTKETFMKISQELNEMHGLQDLNEMYYPSRWYDREECFMPVRCQ